MIHTKYSLLATLFFCLAAQTVLSGQITVGGGTTAPSGNVSDEAADQVTVSSGFTVLGGSELVENDFVKDQAVVYFPEALNALRQEDFTNKVLSNNPGSEVLAFTKGGHYALVRIPTIDDVCEFLGEGNPDLPDMGEGQSIGLNYKFSSISWGSIQDDLCIRGGMEPDLSEYNPVAGCTSSSIIIPETGGSNVRVAILDSGVYPTQSGLLNGCEMTLNYIGPLGVVTVPTGENGPGEQVNNQYTTSTAAHPHGSLVANIITGMALREGIEEQLHLHSYQVLNGQIRTTTFQVVAAIEDIVENQETNPTHILSMSLGFIPVGCLNPANKPDLKHDGDVLDDAIRQVKEAGVIVITSAGNRGLNLDEHPQYPAAYLGEQKVVTVGALSCAVDTPTSFSNYSKTHVDLFTTGAYVRSFDGSCFQEVNGTSFSAPIVAAKAAMHVTNQSNFNPGEVICLLQDQSRNSENNIQEFSTYGLVDAQSSRGFDCTESPKTTARKNTPELVGSSAITPNPFDNIINVNLPASGAETPHVLTILDGTGRVIVRRESRKAGESFDLSALRAGVYWLNVRSAGGNMTRPIVKR